MLAAYWGLQNRVFFFFWISIASINLCWHGIQTFCGSNHLWAYNEVDAYYVMTSSKSGRLSLNTHCLYLNCCWYEFQSSCERNHLWAHNHIDVYYVSALSQIWKISVFVEAYFFSLLKNCCGLKISKFLCKELSRSL